MRGADGAVLRQFTDSNNDNVVDTWSFYRGGLEVNFRRAESAAFFGREIGLMYGHSHLRYCEALDALGGSEGAAGSIYITVPAIFYGAKFRRAADVVLRRVNDVPGSTEVQRRWHIERIDLKSKA